MYEVRDTASYPSLHKPLSLQAVLIPSSLAREPNNRFGWLVDVREVNNDVLPASNKANKRDMPWWFLVKAYPVYAKKKGDIKCYRHQLFFEIRLQPLGFDMSTGVLGGDLTYC
ncbi:jg8795 [Pararge aegeria aegeria]|uniref:Jg8795 protein n=1 Tax=Pararge aegeria aegeria TaxID=348720 RepID=A0A8S4QH77_9NEOP|nr:jg8795 [Pararge aegeria aegeria]